MQGARAPEGSYLAFYPIWYHADEITDSKGKTAVKDLDLDNYMMLTNYLYYKDNYVLAATVPVGKLQVGDEGSGGVGDIEVGAGLFLLVKWADILAGVLIKAPTGPYDKNDLVNFGSGQWDIRPTVFFSKTVDRFTFDAALRYWIKLECKESGWKPGNEFYAEGVVNYKVNDKFRFGPSISFMKGVNGELDGEKFDNTATTKLSVGAEAFYLASSKLYLLLNVMEDIDVINGAKGRLFLGRITTPF